MTLYGILWLGDANNPPRFCELYGNIYHERAFHTLEEAEEYVAQANKESIAAGHVACYAAAILPDGILVPHVAESMHTTAQVEKFFSHNPTLLASIGEFKLWEHPTRGDTAPIYMSTPDGRLISTGFYDLEEFDSALCHEIAGE